MIVVIVRLITLLSIAITELMFDRVLSRGDTVVFEYELRYAPHGVRDREGDRYVGMCRFPIREHVVEVKFSPAAVPARCEWYTAPAGAAERVHELPLRSAYAHAVRLDVPPGRHGIRWHWLESQVPAR